MVKDYQTILKSLCHDKERIPQWKNDLVLLYEEWKSRTPLGALELMVPTDIDDGIDNIEKEEFDIDNTIAIWWKMRFLGITEYFDNKWESKTKVCQLEVNLIVMEI